MLALWGRSIHRYRTLVLVLSAIVLALSVFVLSRGGVLAPANFPTTEADRGQAVLERELGRPGPSSFLVIARSSRATVDDEGFRTALDRTLAPLRNDRRITQMVLPYDLSPTVAAILRSRDDRALVVQCTVRGDIREAQRTYRELRARVRPEPGVELTYTGNLPYKEDLDRTLERDLLKGELVSAPLALLVLLLVFGSVAAASLPVGVGGLAVVAGMAGVFLTSRTMDVTQYSLNVTSLVGLGVAIDYALFIVNRFRDELAAGHATDEALSRTLATAGRAVAFSGVAVAIGMSGLLFYRGTFLASMGVAGALVVGLAVLFALTFLPALLSLLGPRINALQLVKTRKDSSDAGGFWRRIARWVMRRPITVLVPTLALTILAGAPFLRMQMAAASVTVLPPRVEARRGYDTLQRDFPDLAANRVTVVVRLPEGQSALDPDRIRAMHAYSRRIAQIAGVRRVESYVDLDPTLDADGYVNVYGLPEMFRPTLLEEARKYISTDRVITFSAITHGDSHSDNARAVVRALRAMRPSGPGEAFVTGPTAVDVDTTAYIIAKSPAAIGFVMVMTALVLFVLLGSVVLPIKAVLMNLLSLSASFGALVWIFEDGHLRNVLHFEPQPVEPVLPVVLFCAVFGLSMDYEVLMLTRMQEEYLRTRDNTRAVAEGLERSARLVTSAAAIMVAVFSAFALAEVVILKAVGVGMALAVALDATIVRVLIVPATMRLFGDLNWWAPAPLAKLYHALKLGHAEVEAPASAVDDHDDDESGPHARPPTTPEPQPSK
ncbi:MAG: MMPL family transporter [Polyangiales bacterium]